MNGINNPTKRLVWLKDFEQNRNDIDTFSLQIEKSSFVQENAEGQLAKHNTQDLIRLQECGDKKSLLDTLIQGQIRKTRSREHYWQQLQHMPYISI